MTGGGVPDAEAAGAPTPAGTSRDAPRRLARVHLVVNPVGTDRVAEQRIHDALRSAGAATVRVEHTSERDAGTAVARAAMRSGATLLVACGGDGTVRAVSEALAGSAVPLAVIPAGTGNLLARNLGIPLDEADAIAVAAHGRLRALDVGVANGEVFAVMAGTGFDALMMRDTPSGAKARFGSLAYVGAAFRHLRARPANVRVELCDERGVVTGTLGGRASMVLAGNLGELSGGLCAFPDADPSDGALELVVLDATTWRAWARVLLGAVRGHRHVAGLQRARAAGATIRSDRPRPWELDGETRPATRRLDLSVHRDALLVCVPEPVGSDGDGR